MEIDENEQPFEDAGGLSDSSDIDTEIENANITTHKRSRGIESDDEESDVRSKSPRFDEVVNKIESLTPLKRLASPGEVAQIITYLSSDSPLSLCGQTIYIDGGRTL